MNDIQLATTLGTPTGTGKLFKPFSSDANSAVYKEDSPSGRAATISWKRTLPKPNGTSAGVERVEVKLTEYYTISDIEYVTVLSLVSSVPVPITSANRALMVTRLALLAGGTVYADSIKEQKIPV